MISGIAIARDQAARIPIDRMSRALSSQGNVRPVGSWNPVRAPAMNGRGRSLDHARDCSRASEGVDDDLVNGLHAPLYATIARNPQAVLCDNRDCDIRTVALDETVDLEAIREWADAKRGRRQQLADALGIAHDKVSKALSPNGIRRFTAKEMDVVRSIVRADQQPADVQPVRTIPLLGGVPAGSWREAVRHSRGSVPVPDASTPPNAFALTAEGDSMDLVAPDGSTIILDPDDVDLYPDRYYVVRNSAGETTFKQFKSSPARLVPCSSNKAHREMILGRDQFEIVARVIGSYSRL
jgi:SOS-response transcriptional repressor LexA